MGYIYFDFDGTLADSFSLAMEISDYLAPKYGFNKVDKNKIEYYRNLSSQELIKEFNVPLYKIPILAPVFKIEMNKRIDHLKPFDCIPEMLKNLSQNNILGILTSNSVENVEHFLQKHNLTQFISDIRSEFQLFGKHQSLKKILRQKKIPKKKFIYVGDETRDIDAANKIKINSIAVTWGFNSEKALKKHKPTTIAHDCNDIIIFCTKVYKK
jgi:phosphoglycolate phosphatase